MSELTQFRRAKDDFFAHHPQSPLTESQKTKFAGLRYFPENPALDLVVKVREFSEKEAVIMQTSTGDTQRYVKYGTFNFEVNGTTAELTLFVSEHGFFLPFVDSQSGQVTYGAGRYLDPEVRSDGLFHIDFNRAYNPYCAYNERWSCPLPPAENRLEVPIEAGEMNFYSED